jgi:anti-sigma regulatory factor (Ser/Thr protein kinase)
VAVVELSFSALPAHVRTARLVAVAVARRAGVDEALLDEVRLAVGEACSRAVHLHRRYCPQIPVRVMLDDAPPGFAVIVYDQAPTSDPEGGSDALTDLADALDLASSPLPAGIGLAVVSSLVDDVDIRTGASGAIVTMRWPLLVRL